MPALCKVLYNTKMITVEVPVPKNLMISINRQL